VAIGYSLFKLYQALNRDAAIPRNKIKWMFIGMTIGVFGGTTNFFFDYGINIYPFGQFLVILYPLLVSWAIVRYQVLDVAVLLRKTGLLMGIYLFLLALLIPMLLYLNRAVGTSANQFSMLMIFEIIVTGGILSLGPFFYAYFVQRSSFFHEHMLAGLTHELKSPLSIIESAIDILNDNLKDNPHNPIQAQYMDMITRNTNRLRSFVDNLLHMYKIENKKILLQRKTADLIAICDEVIKNLKPLAKSKGLKVQWNRPKNSVEVRCEIEKINQVLSNLLSNAIKYTQKGVVRLTVENQPSEVRVSIEDTGQGIPSADLPLVFDRFFQGSRNRTSKGTGIGLAIAKAWVEAHGGRIYAESKGEGKGSLFWFTLPKI